MSAPSDSTVLSHGAFRRYFVADALSNVGDWFTYVAMATLAATASSTTAQAENLSVVFLSQTLPRVLSAPMAGWICDRFDRKTVLLLVLWLRSALVLLMAWVAFRSGACVWLHALHVLRMALGAVTDGASRAALVGWVGRDLIAASNRVLGGAWSVWLAIGVTLGALCTARFGAPAAFVIDALSFALSALVFATLATTRQAQRVESHDGVVDQEAQLSANMQADHWSSRWWQTARDNPQLMLFSWARLSVALASSAGFLAMGASASRGRTASGTAGLLGGYFLLRAVGNGLGAAWRGFGASPAQLVSTGVLAGIVGIAGVVMITQNTANILAICIGAVAWGWGMGAHWTLACTQLQLRSANHVLGRWLSMDLFVFTSGQAFATLSATLLGRAMPAMRVWTPAVLGAIALALWWIAARRALIAVDAKVSRTAHKDLR